MGATVSIAETNGPGAGTVTDSITNSNMGSTDATNLVALTYPITAGQNSYEKWQRIACTVAGGSSKLLNFKVWASAALTTGCTHLTNLSTSAHAASTYTSPSVNNRSSEYYPNVMPTSTPGTANLTYGGDLAGEMDITSGLTKYSDYMVMQIQTTVAAVAGTSVNMNWQWDEVA